MTTDTPAIVVALFANPTSAGNAVQALRDAGFEHEQIGYVSRTAEAPVAGNDADASNADAASAAALAVGLAGGTVGASAGIGPTGIFAAGALGAAMIASGALQNGVRTALSGAGMSDEEARYYENEYESDRSIVIVKTADRADEAAGILKRHGGVGRVR